MQSLARWATLAPRNYRPQAARTRRAAYSTVEPALTVLRRGNDENAQEVLAPLRRETEIPSVKVHKGKGKEKAFKGMEGNSMNPVSDKGEASPSPRNGRGHKPGSLIASGTYQDNKFLKDLTEVMAWSRSTVPTLAHGLEAVLSRRGVHWVRNPDTGEYVFDKYLDDIPKVSDFAFDRLEGFVKPSEDKNLWSHAMRTRSRFTGSTSSLTGILVQIYLLLSEEKLLNLSHLSAEFEEAPRFFTQGQRIPTSVILTYRDGIYATDYDGERDDAHEEEIILLPLGVLLEKFLTMPPEVFKKFLKSYTKNDHPQIKDVHRYAKLGDFLMRSQLDCRDDSLPGSGVFDLKTRAISQIRHDVHNYMKYLDCSLNALEGRRGTFEEEYYDMTRAAFLEYSFQARIGGMDGVMIAYHNTARIFGFQYVSLREMDRCLFGKEGIGSRTFLRCLRLMELMYGEIARCFPEQSVKCTFEKRSRELRVWVEPVEHNDPDTPPPVVELDLFLEHISDGRPASGRYVVGNPVKWHIKYQIKRIDSPQSQVLERRQMAYKRQMSIARSLPGADVGAQDAQDASDAAEVQDAKTVSEGEVVDDEETQTNVVVV